MGVHDAKTTLAALGIKRIVQVDDANARPVVDVSALTHTLMSVVTASATEGLPRFEASWLDLPEDRRREVYRRYGENLTADEQVIVVKHPVHGADALELEKDVQFQSGLRQTLADAVDDFRELSLADWNRDRDTLLKERHAVPTLFLFDRVFTAESGRPDEGIHIIQGLLAQEGLLAGLVTHTVSSSNEADHWISIAAEFKIPRERLIVTSKSWITDGNPTAFVNGLRRTALARDLTEFTTCCLQALRVAFDDASNHLTTQAVYDIDQAVVRSSFREGVWEADTLFRLFNAKVRQGAMRALRESPKVMESVLKIREGYPEPLDPNVKRAVWRWQRDENYDDPSFVNTHLLPISNGDVFAIGHATPPKRYLLVAQPCDLMVRPKGERVRDSADLNRFGTLVSLSSKPWSVSDGRDLSVDQLRAELAKATRELRRAHDNGTQWLELSLFEENGDPIWVNMADAFPVWLCALDLCAFNVRGESTLDLNVKTASKNLVPAWQNRYGKIHKVFERKLVHIERKGSAASKDAFRALLPVASPGLGAGCEFDAATRIATYPIMRVGRLSEHRAAAVLARFSAYASRAAFEHNLQDNETE